MVKITRVATCMLHFAHYLCKNHILHNIENDIFNVAVNNRAIKLSRKGEMLID